MENSETANAPAPQPLDSWFLDLLACPGCEQRLPLHLNEAKDALLCACGRYSYPIRDGIPILLVEEATVLDANARPEDVIAGAESAGSSGGSQ
jgi:uncharacterized protein YbaR (Trm112 family)